MCFDRQCVNTVLVMLARMVPHLVNFIWTELVCYCSFGDASKNGATFGNLWQTADAKFGDEQQCVLMHKNPLFSDSLMKGNLCLTNH